MEWIINLSVLVLVLGMTYALASEGLWGAALMFMNSLFAGLIALNFYEPLAGLMAQASFLASYADTLSLLVLFTVSLLVLRLATEYLGPTMIRMPSAIYHIGRWTFGFAASCLTMGILLLGFHTAPVHKKMFYGLYSYNLKPPFGMGLDWQWLGLFQYTTGYIFAQYGTGQVDPFKEFEDARVFDPRGRWLIDHQNQRPYGTEGTIPEPPQAAGSAEGGAAGEGGEGGVPGAPGPAPAGPPGPGIPGGTAGAAAGLAPTNP